MAEFPAMPFYTDAYLADTRHLTTEEHGAYLLLLMCAWRSKGCQLKDDDRQLARIVGISSARWKRLRTVLSEFFVISGGYWRQKKLVATHAAVAVRVERNRANGSKGGLASARKRSGKPEVGKTSSNRSSAASATARATKTKPKSKSGSSEWAAVAAAAGLEGGVFDDGFVEGWVAAGADYAKDIVPTLKRIAARERDRVGRVPATLAYYDAAVLEARDKRLRAVKRGEMHAAQNPSAPAKRRFDRASEADWREFLGDRNSRFRGDYLSQNWQIPRDHPVFLSAGLGPDPRHSHNSTIPDAVYRHYARSWGWRPKPVHRSAEIKQTNDKQ